MKYHETTTTPEDEEVTNPDDDPMDDKSTPVHVFRSQQGLPPLELANRTRIEQIP